MKTQNGVKIDAVIRRSGATRNGSNGGQPRTPANSGRGKTQVKLDLVRLIERVNWITQTRYKIGRVAHRDGRGYGFRWLAERTVRSHGFWQHVARGHVGNERGKVAPTQADIEAVNAVYETLTRDDSMDSETLDDVLELQRLRAEQMRVELRIIQRLRDKR